MTLEVSGASAVPARERSLRAAYFRPRPKLTASEWSDRFRMLARVSSAEPGRFSVARAPYQKAILDALSDPSIQRVVWMKPSQVGATEILTNIVGYYIDQDPAPVLVVQPTIEMGRAWSLTRLEPMLRDSPRLASALRATARREKGDTILQKSGPGWQVTVTGANSPASLASRPIRVVLADEVDRYPLSAGDEGDPLTLAIRRTSTFWNRKVFVPSTPTIKHLSRIEALFEASTKQRYHVPCPHCGHEQVLAFGGAEADFGLKWDPGRPETAEYLCRVCHALIPERQKPAMLAAGRWIAEHPERDVVGFHLTALYSPWMRWAEIVTEWLDAKKDTQKLKVFVNTLLAETWEEKADDALDSTSLLARAEQYAAEVPAYVGLLTAGVDVQGDRLECDVWAWGRGEEAALVRHEVLWGDPAKAAVWEQLAALLGRPWQHEGGQTLRIVSCCIDSGGHHTDAVYRFTRRRLGLLLWAVKGVGGPGRAPVTPPARKSKAKVKLVTLGSDALKDVLFARAKIDAAGPGCIHLPAGISPAWVEQLTSEKVLVRYEAGRRVRRYVLPSHVRNEALDMYCYALAALLILGEARREQLGALVDSLAPRDGEAAPAAPAPAGPVRQPFVARRRNWMSDY